MNLPPEYFSTVFLLDGQPPALPDSFAIITAWNPMDRATSDAANHKEDEALRTILADLQTPHFRAAGCSPDLSHREPGWAVAIDKPAAIELGKRFQQRAIWWIEGDNLLLIPCDGATAEDLGSFAARLVPPLSEGGLV